MSGEGFPREGPYLRSVAKRAADSRAQAVEQNNMKCRRVVMSSSEEDEDKDELPGKSVDPAGESSDSDCQVLDQSGNIVREGAAKASSSTPSRRSATENDKGKQETKTAQNIMLIASKPGKLFSLCCELNERQRFSIIEADFGGLLEVQVQHIPSDMTEWLISAFNPETREITHNGRVLFTLTTAAVCDAFLLPWRPSNPVTNTRTAAYNDLRKRWEGLYGFKATRQNYTTSINRLEMKMKELDAGEPDFIRMFLVYAMSVFLDPVCSNRTDFRPLISTVDVELIRTYDWCGYVFDRLCESDARYKGDPDQKTFSGCLLVVVVTYFHRMGRKGVSIQAVAVPLVKNWRTWGLQRRMSQELARGYGSGTPDNINYPIPRRPHDMPAAEPQSSISFSVPADYHTDMQLINLLPNEFQRTVATVARNVNIIISPALSTLQRMEDISWKESYPRCIEGFMPSVIDKAKRAIRLLTKSVGLLELHQHNSQQHSSSTSDDTASDNNNEVPSAEKPPNIPPTHVLAIAESSIGDMETSDGGNAAVQEMEMLEHVVAETDMEPLPSLEVQKGLGADKVGVARYVVDEQIYEALKTPPHAPVGALTRDDAMFTINRDEIRKIVMSMLPYDPVSETEPTPDVEPASSYQDSHFESEESDEDLKSVFADIDACELSEESETEEVVRERAQRRASYLAARGKRVPANKVVFASIEVACTVVPITGVEERLTPVMLFFPEQAKVQ